MSPPHPPESASDTLYAAGSIRPTARLAGVYDLLSLLRSRGRHGSYADDAALLMSLASASPDLTRSGARARDHRLLAVIASSRQRA